MIQPRVPLLVTLALATLAAACKENGGPAPDGAAGTGGSGGRGGAGGADTGGSGGGGTGGSAGRDAGTARDAATPDTALPDRPDSGRMDAAPDSSPDAGMNARQLWFSGPDGDFHLLDKEPEDPF